MASLIKTSHGKVPSRAIQFTDADGVRQTVRLGKCGLDVGRRFLNRIECLVSCRVTNTPCDVESSVWLAGLPDPTHEKLASVGLVKPRVPVPTSPTLKE